MSISTNARRLAGAALLALASLTAVAQENTNNEGAAFGQELLRNVSMPTHDAAGGREGTGTFTIGNTTIDAAEVAAGATREKINALGNENSSMSELEQRGIERFNQAATEEGAQGDAVRVLAAGNTMSASQIAGKEGASMGEAARQFLVKDPVAESFADCESTTTTTKSKIATYKQQDYTCAVGTEGTACGRARSVNVVRADGGPDACASNGNCDPTNFQLEDSIAFNGQCESETTAAGCETNWVCTDSGARTVDGVLIDETVARARGLQPLYPGAPALCWAATTRTTCPVCIDDEKGRPINCRNVEISTPEANSCGQYASNGLCRATGSACLLYGEDGQCSVHGQRYTCSTPVEVRTEDVQTTNSCQAITQCSDGSCHSGMQEKGMSIQEAMARLAVTSSISTDMTRSDETRAESNGGSTKRITQTGSTDSNDLAAKWGYDQAGIEEGEVYESELTAEQQQQMAEVQLFRGNAYSCQKAYGGLVDCCQATDGGAMKLFWEIHAQITRQNQAAEAQRQGGVSGYTQMANGQANTGTLYSPFTSMADNVRGGGSAEYNASTLTIWQQFMARARAEIKPALSPKWACSDVEFDLAVQREVSMCSFAGTYCSKSVLGTCLKRREAYCCYKSPMSKMLRASVEPGGVLTHGNPKAPDCSGVPLDELDKIDWSVMDFNQLAGNMAEGGMFDKLEDKDGMEERLTGKGATNASSDRKTVSVRTSERLGNINGESVTSSISTDIRNNSQLVQGMVQASPATISFAGSYRTIPAGTPAAIGLERVGTAGAATVTVRVAQGSPETAGFTSQQVRWGNGEMTSRNIRLNPPKGARGRIVLEIVATEGRVGSNRLITVDIQ